MSINTSKRIRIFFFIFLSFPRNILVLKNDLLKVSITSNVLLETTLDVKKTNIISKPIHSLPYSELKKNLLKLIINKKLFTTHSREL